MIVFTAGVALFLIALAIHVALWRIHVPKRQGRVLGIIFLMFLVVWVGLFLLLAVLSIVPEFSLPQLVLTILFYSSLCIVYFILFTAIEADSPTLTMIELIFKYRDHGIKREDLLRKIELHSFAQLRLDQLLRDDMVIVDGARLRPTDKGRVLISLILGYRRLLGRTQMGG